MKKITKIILVLAIIVAAYVLINMASASTLGDLNGDGVVNGSDYALMDTCAAGSCIGDNAYLFPLADLNHDGVINNADYTILDGIVTGTYSEDIAVSVATDWKPPYMVGHGKIGECNWNADGFLITTDHGRYSEAFYNPTEACAQH